MLRTARPAASQARAATAARSSAKVDPVYFRLQVEAFLPMVLHAQRAAAGGAGVAPCADASAQKGLKGPALQKGLKGPALPVGALAAPPPPLPPQVAPSLRRSSPCCSRAGSSPPPLPPPLQLKEHGVKDAACPISTG